MKFSIALLLALVWIVGWRSALAAPGDLTARELDAAWRWRFFLREEHLSSGPAPVLGHEYRDDMVYLAMPHGLFRFNGYRWTQLSTAQPMETASIDRIIDSGTGVFVTTPAEVWVIVGGLELHRVFQGGRFLIAASPVGGVVVVDLENEESIRLGENGQRRRGGGPDRIVLPEGEPEDYAIDDDWVHWLATTQGLYRRDEGKGIKWRKASLGPELDRLPCRRLFLIKEVSIRRSLLSKQVNVSPLRHQLWAQFESLGGEAVLARRTKPGDWEIITIDASAPVLEHLVRDGRGRFYAITAAGELFFSPAGRTWTRVEPAPVSGGKLRSGLLDRHGYVWFAMEYSPRRGGVARVDPESRRWERIADRDGKLEDLHVLSLFEAGDGSVWLGAESGLYESHADGSLHEHAAVGRTPLQGVTGIAEDRAGRIWVSSTRFRGAFFHDRGHWVRYGAADARDDLPDLSQHTIGRIVSDGRGQLWFLPSDRETGGTGYPLYRYSMPFRNPRVERLERFEIPHGPVNDFLQSSHDESYWVATEEGLLQLRPLRANERGVERFRVERRFTEAEGLRSTRIWAVAQHPGDRSIWICYPSSGSGVTRIRGDTLTHFDERNGLASPIVWSIATTYSRTRYRSFVWLGTDRGIARYDGDCWYTYPVAGDPKSSKVWPVIPSGPEGDSVLVGTFGNGAFRFRLDDRHRPQIIRTDFARRRDSRGALAFSWDARDFKEDTAPEALLFRHRLDDGPWSPISTSRSAVLEGVDPGQHSFQVEVRDLDGNSPRNPVFQVFNVVAPTLLPAWLRWLLLGTGGLVGILLLAAGWVALSRSLRPILRYRGAFRGVDAAVLILDDHGRIVEYNGVHPELLGLEALRTRKLYHLPALLLPPLQDEELRATLSSALDGRARECHLRDRLSGPGRDLTVQGIPLRPGNGRPVIGVALIIWDGTPTQRARLEDERQRRLTAVRELSDRVGGQLGESAGSLRRELERLAKQTDSGKGEDLAGLRSAVERVEDLTRALREFSGGEEPRGRKEISVVDLLEDVVRPSLDGALRLPGNIRVDFRGQPGLWMVGVEEGAIRRALEEVIQNAVDAMPRGGDITIRLSNCRLEEREGELQPGRYVEISVVDAGTGMPDGHAVHVFDPLFSTKPRHRHRGIGLSLAHGIVRRHGGDIRLDSRPERGTRVRIYLPVIGEEARGA